MPDDETTAPEPRPADARPADAPTGHGGRRAGSGGDHGGGSEAPRRPAIRYRGYFLDQQARERLWAEDGPRLRQDGWALSDTLELRLAEGRIVHTKSDGLDVRDAHLAIIGNDRRVFDDAAEATAWIQARLSARRAYAAERGLTPEQMDALDKVSELFAANPRAAEAMRVALEANRATGGRDA